MNGVVIRSLRADDFEAFQRLFEMVDDLHRRALPEYFRKPERPARTPEIFAGWIQSPDRALYGAEKNGRVVGFVYVLLQEFVGSAIHVPRKFGLLDVLVVDKDFRDLGIGTALVKAAEEWAKRKGAATMELAVWEFAGPSPLFYQKLGYQTLSRKMSTRL